MRGELGKRGALAALAIAGAASGAASISDAHADHPRFHFPAPAGTEWEVAAGYNTATHDAMDPHALDLVRVDAPTAGSSVLSPVGGEVWSITGGSSCITIRDAHGLIVLLCHVYPVAGLQEGQRVEAGQPIATVAPAGEAANNGLAHIHLAIHRHFEAGQLQTVPFSGDYAIEGQQLPNVSDFNAYAGVRFTSTLGDSAGQVAPNPFSAPGGAGSTETAPASTAVRVTSTGPYVRGMNGIVVQGGGEAAAVAVRIASESGRSVMALWLLSAQGWRFHVPDAPDASGGLDELPSGAVAIFALLD